MRWVDINKGDEVHPEYRSRLVAQEIKTDKREKVFAATPPLEAKKLVFMMCTWEDMAPGTRRVRRGMKLDFIDVRRAYFNAPARRKVFIKLPPEDEE